MERSFSNRNQNLPGGRSGTRIEIEIAPHFLSMNPKVKFKIDPRQDIGTAKGFINESRFDDGRNLEWAFFRMYPHLRDVIRSKNDVDYAFLEKHIAEMYRMNREAAASNFKRYESDWRKLEKRYFALVKELFPDTPWPKGKYIAYATIWGMFPRFLDDKTFQLPIKFRSKRYVSTIIAHEMLHFIFYEHIQRNYRQYKNIERNFLVWHISEIFNSLVQDSPAWLRLFKKRCMPYPEHEKIIAKLQKRYPDPAALGADGLIRQITPYARKVAKS